MWRNDVNWKGLQIKCNVLVLRGIYFALRAFVCVCDASKTSLWVHSLASVVGSIMPNEWEWNVCVSVPVHSTSHVWLYTQTQTQGGRRQKQTKWRVHILQSIKWIVRCLSSQRMTSNIITRSWWCASCRWCWQTIGVATQSIQCWSRLKQLRNLDHGNIHCRISLSMQRMHMLAVEWRYWLT